MRSKSFTLVPGMESGGGFSTLLGSRPGPAGQERPVRDPVRRHDAAGGPPAPRRGRRLHAGGLARDPRRRGRSRGQLRPAKGGRHLGRRPPARRHAAGRGRRRAGVSVATGVPHQRPAADGQRSPDRQDGRRRPFHLPAAGAAVHDRRAPRSRLRRADDPQCGRSLTGRPDGPALGPHRGDAADRPTAGGRPAARSSPTTGMGDTPASHPLVERRGHDRRCGPVRLRAGHAGRGHDLADDPDQANALEPDVGPQPHHAGRGRARRDGPR